MQADFYECLVDTLDYAHDLTWRVDVFTLDADDALEEIRAQLEQAICFATDVMARLGEWEGGGL